MKRSSELWQAATDGLDYALVTIGFVAPLAVGFLLFVGVSVTGFLVLTWLLWMLLFRGE